MAMACQAILSASQDMLRIHPSEVAVGLGVTKVARCLDGQYFPWVFWKINEDADLIGLDSSIY